MKWLSIIAIAASLGGCIDHLDSAAVSPIGTPMTELQSESTCWITRIVDGDTLAVTCDNGSKSNARLLGFDAPETYRPGCDAERSLGQLATQRLRHIVNTASALSSITADRKDKYGRLLTRLYADGQDVGDILIAEQLARPYVEGKRGSWCAEQT